MSNRKRRGKLCERRNNDFDLNTSLDDIEYVIYCRKSTDEATWRQNQSIVDQINICMEFAKREGLKVMKKPSLFPFETKEDVNKELNDKDEYSKDLYKKYQKYFIIKEQKSAKEAGIRNKWKELIKMVKNWKIKWIISYLPDRQSRNMLESGELIDLLDKWMINLKYSNFNFTNNASGKMMLGIHFAISKEYSDNISDNVWRWIKWKIDRWQSMWSLKYGYIINDEDFYEPHPIYFDLFKEAFRLKIHKLKSDTYIVDWLNKQWFKRVLRNGIEREITHKTLAKVWLDPFYYGILIHWKNESNQMALNKYYEQMISEWEHELLLMRHYSQNGVRWIKSIKKGNDEIYPFEYWVVTTLDNFVLTPNIPNKWRFQKKLEKDILTDSQITLWDVIKPVNIKYTCTNKDSKHHKLQIGFDIIEEELIKKFKSIHITKEAYDEYLLEAKDYLNNVSQDTMEERKKLQLQINSICWVRDKFIKNMLWKERDTNEEKVYQNKKEEFNQQMKYIQKEIDNVDTKSNNLLLDFEVLLKTLQNLGEYYPKVSYVRKKKISKILISNITIKPQHKVEVYFKEWFDTLFDSNGAGDETRTRNQQLGRLWL